MSKSAKFAPRLGMSDFIKRSIKKMKGFWRGWPVSEI